MLKSAERPDLYAEWLAHISASEVREAFLNFIGAAACSQKFECYPQRKGSVRDFRFYNSLGEQVFAFIVNKQWLLFYFLPPAIRSGTYNFEGVRREFPTASINNIGEWTVRIHTPVEVLRLREMIDLA